MYETPTRDLINGHDSVRLVFLAPRVSPRVSQFDLQWFSSQFEWSAAHADFDCEEVARLIGFGIGDGRRP